MTTRAAFAWTLATAFFFSVACTAFVFPPSAEAQTTREGVLRETIADSFVRNESTTTYSLLSGGAATTVVPTSPVAATTGDRVAVTGTMHEGELVGSLAKEQDLTPEAELVAPRKVAVLLIKFPGDPAQPWPLAQTREEVFTGQKSANTFFQEESFGKIALAGEVNPDGDVFGWFTLNAPTSGCDTETWDAEAREAAEGAGISFSGYDHIVYVSTFQPSCPWLGLATLGGGTANINGTSGGVHVISHELGHNLNLNHAGSWSCTKGGVRVPISNSCVASEYGDVFDVMGNVSTRHSSAWNLRRLGVISLANNIETVSADGTYTLKATLTATPAPKVLRIARADSPPGGLLSWYYLEIRQMGGLFENVDDATMDGVSIRATAEGSSPETLLIDCNPATTTFADAPLPVGHTFSDGDVHITVLSAGGGTASVSVGFGAFTDSEAPTAPTGLSASQDATGVKLQWSASEDNVGVTRYVVFRDGSEIGTTPITAFTDANAAVGLHAYTVYADDEAGNRSPESAPKVFSVADTEAPTVPTAPADPPAGQEKAAPGVPAYSLTVRLGGGGSGSVGDGTGAIACPPTCSHSYAEGTRVALAATPAPGSKFAGWLGGGCAGAGACQLTIGTDRALTATFVKAPPARAGLRIGRVRSRAVRSNLEVAVGGTIAGRARGVVDVSAHLPRRRVSATESARIAHGSWQALLVLPGSALADGARIDVTARFKGSPGVRSDHTERRAVPKDVPADSSR
jgi:hypothetical protein